MKIKSQRDFWSGVMFIGVGVAFAWGATDYSFGNSARPGPGFFPFGLGVLMALLGAIVLFKALTIETATGDPIGAFAWKPLLIILGSIVLFGLMLPKLGLVVTLPVLITLASTASDEFHFSTTLISAAVLTLGSWLVFIVGLSLTIPLWPTFITG